jgi:pyrroline-5-carboxylate reductase
MSASQGLLGKRVLVVGAGNMGGAILLRLKSKRLASLSFYEIDGAKARAFAGKSGLKSEPSLEKGIRDSDIVVLAVKPQSWPELSEKACGLFRKGQIIITIMAGVRIASIAARVRPGVDIVRAMPNTPALVGEGFTAVAGDNPRCVALARAVFSCVGGVMVVKEKALDAVTALSGAGPAYVFAFIEHFTAAARAQGFSAGDAEAMVVQTLTGALKLLKETRGSPGDLRKKVTSPGGVTEAALKVMDRLGFNRLLSAGVRAGVRRAAELGK